MVRRLFLTPASLPETTVSRCLIIPDSREWLGIFNAALLATAQAYNYEQVNDTDMAPEDVAAVCYSVYEAYLLGECAVNCLDAVACLYPAGRQQRMNATTGRLEVSDDNGETWQDASAQDPRFVAPRNEQATGYTCDDAKAIVGYLQAVQESLLDQMDVANVAIGLVTTLVGVLATVFSFGLAAPIALAFATVLVGTTRLAIEAALTADVWERLVCNVFENIVGAFQITVGMFDDIMDRLLVDESGLAYTVLWHTLNQLGPVGLHNAVGLDTPGVDLPADCDSCGAWCHTFDFTADDGGWTVVSGRAATWNSGVGWEEGVWSGPDLPGCATRFYATVNIERSFTASTVTRIAFTYSGDNGFIDDAAAINNQINGELSGVNAISEVENENFGTNITMEWTGSEVVDEISLQASAGTRCGSSTGIQSANYRIHQVVIEGTGTNPFGTDNC